MYGQIVGVAVFYNQNLKSCDVMHVATYRALIDLWTLKLVQLS